MYQRILSVSVACGLCLACALTLAACTILSEPDTHQLIIEQGFYEKVGVDASGHVRYNLEFTYYVTGEPCEVGGYGVSFNTGDEAASIWYVKKRLEPGKRYVISDVFRVSSELEAGPVVTMEGYLIDSSETHEELWDVLVLQAK